jgi:predicted transcriptional regulator of viral defense system
MNLSRWQREGLLERVTRGAYLLRDVKTYAPAVACLLVPDSYISLESAMSHHGMILDRIYRTDLACVRRVKSFSVRGTEIRVSKIPPHLYCGWNMEESIHGTVRMASAEKALFDRIYLDRNAVCDCTYFEEIGLQPDAINIDRFNELTALSPKVKTFLTPLKEYCNE